MDVTYKFNYLKENIKKKQKLGIVITSLHVKA